MFWESFQAGDWDYFLQWMKHNWTLSIYISLLYVIFIFWGQSYMKSRPALNLRPQLFLWSLALAVFSIWGSYHSFSGIFSDAKSKGWLYTMCSVSYYNESNSPHNSPLWALLFIFSKLPELGDTVFIVLRKQKLIFLHWYHHITVFVYCWYSYGHPVATGRWFSAINYSVHAVMYSYYTLRATGRRTPKFIPICITSLQILQMVAGIFVNVYALKMLYSSESCYVGITNIVISLLMYASYFVLFSVFFRDSYLKKRSETSKLNSKEEIRSEEKQLNGSPVNGEAVNGELSNHSYNLRKRNLE
jgi:elongation of very long chain fatty acids protein 6